LQPTQHNVTLLCLQPTRNIKRACACTANTQKLARLLKANTTTTVNRAHKQDQQEPLKPKLKPLPGAGSPLNLFRVLVPGWLEGRSVFRDRERLLWFILHAHTITPVSTCMYMHTRTHIHIHTQITCIYLHTRTHIHTQITCMYRTSHTNYAKVHKCTNVYAANKQTRVSNHFSNAYTTAKYFDIFRS